jgi:hypothetical protein
MMIVLLLIKLFIIRLIHFFADFVVQTKWQAENKYKNELALFLHVLTYTLVWVIIVWVYTHDIALVIRFCGYTLVLHWATDMITSYLTHKAFITNKNHRLGFQIVEIDQMIHFIQLCLCWEYFIGF